MFMQVQTPAEWILTGCGTRTPSLLNYLCLTLPAKAVMMKQSSED
jgi:hypothetical protein